MRNLCTFLLFFGLFSNLFAQNNFWTPMKPEAFTLQEGAERKIQPLQSKTFQLDYAGLKTALSNAPMEFSVEAKQQPVALSLPLADGSLHTFYVWESPVMAPELMAKFPAIRTYAGADAEGLGLTIRLDVGYEGLHAFIFNAYGKFQSVRPYADGTDEFYMAYRQEDLPKDQGTPGSHGSCGVEEDIVAEISGDSPANKVADRGEAELVTLRKYRLAVSTQGEYSQYHGGNKPQIMSAIVTAVNFIVAIVERDWAVRLELIPNNDTLIYLDPNTDPFSGPLIPNWIGDNPGAINPRVGVNSYDIGHLFARVSNPGGIYVAGQAQLASVCNQTSKAIAGSSLPNPVGEDYYLIIAHEMGHQFSATHTFNSCPPSQDAASGGTAYEPGGGSTIMSYSTTCTPDIVDNTDGYFHVANLEQVKNFITVNGGSTCGQAIVTDNHAPEVTIPLTNGFYIPINTFFDLTGNVTDMDGDNLTYCWEEFDLGPVVPLGMPVDNSPIFRSLPPDASPTRTFPRITNIVSNTTSNTEVLPTYSRDLKFKLTARDNYPGSGGIDIAEVRFRSAVSAGPFRVTYPNLNTDVWNVGEFQTVTWNVTNTDLAPVNCKKVNIRLSIDGGFTYPITLAEGQPNIGRACIKVPNNIVTTARVRVEAADNIFFDISNFNFKIQAPAAGSFSLCAGILKDLVCLPSEFSTEISTIAVAGFSGLVTLTATGLPVDATAVFSPNPVPSGSSSTLTVTLPPNFPEGTFNVTVLGTSGIGTSTSVITLTAVSNDFTSVAPTSPVNGASGVNTQPLLQWSTANDANVYEVELATSPSFLPNTIVATISNTTLASFQITTALMEGSVYYWRIRPKNECGEGEWSETQVFIVSLLNCSQLVANDLPKNISANGTPTVESKITLIAGGQISDLNVTRVQGFHDYFKDLEAHLISPIGTDVLLWKDRCGSYNGTFNIGFDDGAGAVFSCPPPSTNTSSKPSGLLNTFNGEDAAGVWTLRIKDNAVSSGGSLTGFDLQICSNEATNPPVITVNNILQPVSGNNAAIDASFLKAEDSNNVPSELVFTLVTVPQNGLLESNGSVMPIGGQFTQFDIDNGALRYFDYGFNAGTDEFRFVVSDGEGGMATGTYQISPLVGTKDPLSGLAFNLSPNPANDVLRLSINETLTSDALVSMYNTAGQRVRTWSLAAGNTFLTMQIADLPDGVYAVSIENETVRGVKKVVVR
ncbi:MAG: M12 family metallo-peptidase [Saprospiraceae bacterium]|nr:M12 family metallo-peptidase [Saprospiraceae bacterium]